MSNIITLDAVAVYIFPNNYNLEFDGDGCLLLPTGTRVADIKQADFEGETPLCVLYQNVEDVPADWQGGKYLYNGAWSLAQQPGS